MLHRIALLIALVPPLSLGAARAFAQTEAISEAREVRTHTGLLTDQTFALLPELGAFAFKDSNGSTGSRGAIGLAFDFDLAHLGTQTPRELYAGISTGALYSHVGGPDANFFGYNSSIAPLNATANVVIIPADIKIGYNASDRFRISAHGGANAIYNSQPGSVQLGNGNHWNLFPNVGGDLDFGFAPNITLGIRPDFTFAPGSDFFTGTLEFGYGFG